MRSPRKPVPILCWGLVVRWGRSRGGDWDWDEMGDEMGKGGMEHDVPNERPNKAS